MKRRFVLAASLALALSIAHGARADEVQEQCIRGYEQGQRLPLGGHLRAARTQLLACAQPECPAVTQGDCGKWLAALDVKLPTVIVSAKDMEGRDLETLRVTMDDEVLVERLDGRPFAVDPGPHTFRYEYDGRALEERVVIIEGEKGRRLIADYTRLAPPAPPERKRPKAITYVLGGVSALSLIGFAGFAASGKATEKCVPACTSEDVDAFRRDYLIADVSLSVAVVAAGAALYFALTNDFPAARAPIQAASWR